jgi:CBS domain-containing protein
MRISEIFSTDVELATPDMTILEIAQKMKERDCGSVPVRDGDRLAGMITDRDIVVRCIAEGKDPEETTAGEVMTSGILYCYDDEDAKDVAKNMAETKVRRLPVLNRDKRLVGIVSLGDLSVGCEDNAILGETMERIRVSA